VLHLILRCPFVRKEALRHPYRADLEAVGVADPPPLTNQEFRASAADIEESDPIVENRERLQHAEIDQARLLEAGDNLHLDPGLLPNPKDELITVGSLTHGACGHRPDRRMGARRHQREELHCLHATAYRIIRENFDL
jgi:hypothetical protein